MLKTKNKKTIMALLLATALVFCAHAQEDNEINVEQLAQSNPFAQFAGTTDGTQALTSPKPDLVVETVILKFLDAASLKSSMSNMSSEYGNIEPDAKSNALIICDTEENVQKIITQIRKADKKPEQIMIEVVLIDVKLNDDTEMGVNWDFLSGNQRNNNYRQSLDYANRVGVTEPTGAITDFVSNSLGSFGGNFSIINGDIRNVIHLLQTKQDVEILASPRIMVVSGQTASIEAVEEVPYTETSDTSEGGSLTSTEFKDVGVKLNVSATLTDDNSILLSIESEQKVTTGTSSTGVPQVDARIVKTSLLLEDGQLVSIGGLRRKELKEQASQIPILGDLPGIGFAFKSTDSVENHSELLVLISPHIYRNQLPSEEQIKKYKEITNQPMLKLSRKDIFGNEKKEKIEPQIN